MKRLLKLSVDCGRGGGITMLAVVETEDYRMVRRAVENRDSIYLGEVNGKHSEVFAEAVEIEVVSTDPAFVAAFEETIGDRVGPDFVGTLRDSEADGDDEEDDEEDDEDQDEEDQ